MGIIGLVIPPFSSIGIGDYIVGRWKYGLAHTIILIPTLAFGYIFFPINVAIVVINFIFGLYESILLIILSKKIDERNPTQSENIKNNKADEVQKQAKSKSKAICSLIIAIFHCLLWALLLINSVQYQGQINDSSGGAIIWLAGFYYIFFGIALTIISYIFAFQSLNGEGEKISRASLIVHSLTLIEFLLFFITSH